MSQDPSANYGRVWLTFLRNSLVREMAFRGNFLINVVTRAFWFAAQMTLFEIIFGKVGDINGWTREQYFAFLATGMLINAIVEGFFMPNCAHFSELIRTGNLDFVLLKPIDTQFLVSCEKIEVAMVNQILLAGGLLGWALTVIGQPITFSQVVIYGLFIFSGVMFFYGLMIAVASTSIWFGRNTGLYDFWFYITSFARYPRSIWNGIDPARLEAGEVIQGVFTWALPILLVITIPAQAITGLLSDWTLAVMALSASVIGLGVSRLVFNASLRSYRSASS